jgi:hypothetical protein
VPALGAFLRAEFADFSEDICKVLQISGNYAVRFEAAGSLQNCSTWVAKLKGIGAGLHLHGACAS